jgi:hypothetical protein
MFEAIYRGKVVATGLTPERALQSAEETLERIGADFDVSQLAILDADPLSLDVDALLERSRKERAELERLRAALVSCLCSDPPTWNGRCQRCDGIPRAT